MTAAPTPKRVRAGQLSWIEARLSERDWKILELVNQLHLMTGLQIDRLCFAELTDRSRVVARSRCLTRLVQWRILTRLPRRVGGAARGSSVAVYGVGTVGQRLLVERAQAVGVIFSIRAARAPGERFVNHIVATSQLYVDLVESTRTGSVTLSDFQCEPAVWWPLSKGRWLKPDAFAAVAATSVAHLWWIEVDRATESLTTVQRKLRTYLDFLRSGQPGPRGGLPRVLITVPTEHRQVTVSALTARLPAPSEELFQVVRHEEAAAYLVRLLQP